jgi:putative acetyltransferase
VTVIKDVDPADAVAMEDLRRLLRAYADHVRAAAGEEHICLTSYERELENLSEYYRVMLQAYVDGQAAGCVLLKEIVREVGEAACEMKRLWVAPEFRACGLGKALIERLVERATSMGFASLYLDTIPEEMTAAYELYRKLGFEPVPRYNQNLFPGVVFLRRRL